jgi:hypothetical protein
VVSWLASSAGEKNGMFNIATPSRIQSVRPARCARDTTGSKTLRCTSMPERGSASGSTGTRSRWNVQAVR